MPLHFDATYIARARGYAVPKRPGHVTTRRLPSNAFKPGNKMAMKHGAYATAFVQPEEKEQFETLRQELARDFKNEVGVDTAMLDAATLLLIRHGRAVLAGEQDLANKTMASILAMLDRLKATKVSREGDKPSRSEITPAQWAAKLLASTGAKKGSPAENAEKMADNTGGANMATPINSRTSEVSETENGQDV